MPCTYDSDASYNLVSKSELDKATRVACKLVRGLESIYEDLINSDYDLKEIHEEGYIDEEVYDWIIDHKNKDEARKLKLRETALAKLNKDEREALGY